jgi:photosystem II stability/assembly factor-like uncharacterized protein
VSRPRTIRKAWPVGSRAVWEWTELPTRTIDDRVERSTDAGRHWADVTPPILARQSSRRSIGDLFALDPTHAWLTYGAIASYSAQTLVSTSDGGRRWRVVGPLPDRKGCEVQFVDADDGTCTFVGAAAGSSGVTVYRTSDGGASWRLMSRVTPEHSTPGGLPWGCDKNVAFTSASSGWAAFTCAGGTRLPLYRTNDGGARWTPTTVQRPAGPLDDGFGFTAMPVVFSGGGGAAGITVGDARATIEVTRDGGTTWQAVSPPDPAHDWVVDPLSARRWILVGGDRMLVTNDAGRTWRPVLMNHGFGVLSEGFGSPPTPVVDFVSRRVGWISVAESRSAGVWRTVDGGRRWTRLPTPSA